MGIFNKKKNETTSDIESETNNEVTELKTSEELHNTKDEIIKEDEWIWVEGYKGTDKNMKCRDVQYELNKTYTYDGKIELCESGYHFCKELVNVFNYYSLENENRFFKVKCLITKEQLESANDKLVAKEITFTEELGFNELENFILKKYLFIHNKEDWDYINKNGVKSYYRKYFMKEMKDSGYGETFSNILYEDINKIIEYDKERERRNYYSLYNGIYSSNSPRQYYSPKYDYRKLETLLKKVKCFKEEGLSKDMSVYLLLKSIA